MKVKVCGIRSAEDIQTALDTDADAIGFFVGQVHKSPDFILPSTAGRLAAGLPPFITPVLVTHLNNVSDIIDIIGKSSISTIQLHGNLSVDQVKELNDHLPPGGKIILAAYLTPGETPDLVEYYPFISAVLLDAFNESPELIETGTHEKYFWNEAAEFVKKCPLPVILAGGLTPANINEAVITVKPYAVDANRGLKEESGGNCCEYRCKAFIKTAKNPQGLPKTEIAVTDDLTTV